MSVKAASIVIANWNGRYFETSHNATANIVASPLVGDGRFINLAGNDGLMIVGGNKSSKDEIPAEPKKVISPASG